MDGPVIYEERVTSWKTVLLFAGLTVLSLWLLKWRMEADGLDALAGLFLFFAILFLFYMLNYPVLVIRLTPQALKLSFGIFGWVVPVDNIGECRLDDDLPGLKKHGGAGIHFMFVRQRYRVSFNFLEHPRVVLALRKAGRVKDVSFSTRCPEEVMGLIRGAMRADQAA